MVVERIRTSFNSFIIFGSEKIQKLSIDNMHLELELEDLKDKFELDDFGLTLVYQHAKNFIALGRFHLHQYKIETGQYDKYSEKGFS